MGTVVQRCSVEATQLEMGRQFCFLQSAAKSLTKQHKLERSSVQGRVERERKTEKWRLSAREKAKACKERFCYQILSEGNRWRVRAPRERERQNEIEINTYLQQHVFSSSHWDLVQNINGDPTAEMAMWETKRMRGEGSRKRVDRHSRGKTENHRQIKEKRSRKRQMKEINNGMRDRVAPELGRKITIRNRKLWHMGGLTKREIESQTEEVGQMERRKKWVSDRWDERFERRREINEEVQWPVSRERLARQNAAVTRIDMRGGKSVSVVGRQTELCLCLKMTLYRWQVKPKSLQFY